MPHKPTITENWKAFLADVDNALTEKFILRCLGGFVLAAAYGLPRPTGDMDCIEITPADKQNDLLAIAGQSSALAKKHKLYIQKAGIAKYPYEFESRLEKLELGFEKLELQILGPYDLVLSKLCSDRTKDTEDAKFLIKEAGLELNKFLEIWDSEMKFQVHDRYGFDIEQAKEYFHK
jgi:Nucleotidyltransferase of unknown function (DUF6036)